MNRVRSGGQGEGETTEINRLVPQMTGRLPLSVKRYYPTFTIKIIIDISSFLTTNPKAA